MNILTNESLVRRNTRIAQFSGLAGLLVLFAGMYLLFTRPNEFALIWGAVLGGFILSQIGIYFTNRWGRRPRPDEKLNQALKGLNDNYTLYHYKTPTAHLLVGPAGIWALMPRYQRGQIYYDKNRWRQRGGGLFLSYMKIFGQEGIGRPDLEIASEVEAVQRFLKKRMPDEEIPPVQAALVFTDPRVELLDVEGAPVPTLQPKKLKDAIRKAVKTQPLSAVEIQRLRQAIEGE